MLTSAAAAMLFVMHSKWLQSGIKMHTSQVWVTLMHIISKLWWCYTACCKAAYEGPLLAGLGDALINMVAAGGSTSMPRFCAELSPSGTLSLLQVSA